MKERLINYLKTEYRKKNNDFLRKCIIYDGNMANIRKNEFACFS